MERSIVDMAYDHVTGISRSYSDWPVTVNPCNTTGCSGSARGDGICADCHEKKLADIVGSDKAKELHDAVIARNNIWQEIKTALKGR